MEPKLNWIVYLWSWRQNWHVSNSLSFYSRYDCGFRHLVLGPFPRSGGTLAEWDNCLQTHPHTCDTLQKRFFPGFRANKKHTKSSTKVKVLNICSGTSAEWNNFLRQLSSCTWNTHPTSRYSPAEMLNFCRILQQINKHTSCCVWKQFMLFHSRPTWWRCVGPRGIQTVQICTF